jgi:DnaJ-class molecular chaperone
VKNIKTYNEFLDEGLFNFFKKEESIPQRQYNIEEEEEEEEFEEEPDEDGMVRCYRCFGRGTVPGDKMWVVVPMPVSDKTCPVCHGEGKIKKEDVQDSGDVDEY